MWTDGWNWPIDPVGDCRFERKGDRLTITVPGKGHVLDPSAGGLLAPHLLRDVEGDFAVQVRVGGDFQRAKLDENGVFRRAGLLLTDGKEYVKFVRAAYRGSPGEKKRGYFRLDAYHLSVEFFRKNGGTGLQSTTGPPLKNPAYLRLERRGEDLTFLVSQDGEKWEPAAESSFKIPHTVTMPRTVKVGVVAEASARATFKAVFDQFRLTPLTGPAGSRGREAAR
jgi:regulation of enolase protein 1 (concanavalin A-like superfamily)